MNEFESKFSEMEQSVSQEKGDFTFFALFLPEDAQDKWDLLVAAPWITRDKEAALRYLAGIVQRTLSPAELLRFSRIVIVDDSDPAVQAINRSIGVKHAGMEVKDNTFFGVHVKHAFIITSELTEPSNQAA